MPEGPEIRRAADKIAAALEGQRVQSIEFAFDRLRKFEERLTGVEIESVEPHGKALLVRFVGEWNIYSHNQLYGRWHVRKRDSYPKTTRSLRLAIHTARHSALLYSASDIDVLLDDELSTHPFLSRLGPDVLDPSVDGARVAERLQSKRFRGRRLAGLLLDQHFLCGTGNYLRSEILFVAGLPHSVRPRDLTEEEVDRLSTATLELSRRAYRTGGITNDPEIVRELKSVGKTRARYRHFVFGRNGHPCRYCDTTILREEAAGRRVYLCPVCQPVERT